jgi:hypothetical protein
VQVVIDPPPRLRSIGIAAWKIRELVEWNNRAGATGNAMQAAKFGDDTVQCSADRIDIRHIHRHRMRAVSRIAQSGFNLPGFFDICLIGENQGTPAAANRYKIPTPTRPAPPVISMPPSG